MLDNISELIPIEKTFADFDRDKDGRVSIDELVLGLAKLGFKLERRQAINVLSFYDLNGDSKLDFSEFTRTLSKDKREFTIIDLLNIFKSMDKELKQSLSSKELLQLEIEFGVEMKENEIEKLVCEFDFDQDGRIAFDEFLRMINKVIN